MSKFGIPQAPSVLRLFANDGDAKRLRRENPIPVFDDPISFYEYLVLDPVTKRKVDHPIDHDTGELGAPLPPDCELAEHKYFYNLVLQKGSATSYVHSFFAEYDAPGNIKRLSEGPSLFGDAGKKYFLFAIRLFEEELLGAKAGDELRHAFWKAVAFLLKARHGAFRPPAIAAFEARYRAFVSKAIPDWWKAISTDALTRGRAMHRAIELCYNGVVLASDPVLQTLEMEQFARFHEFWVLPRGLRMLRTELSMAHRPDPTQPDVLLCGTCDAVFINEKGEIVLADWKRSKEIKTEAWDEDDVGEGPCAGLPNCNLFHYYMQLNTYQYMLEQNTEYRVVSRHICVFHPKQADYAVYDAPEMQDRIDAAMKLYVSRRHAINDDAHRDE